MGCLPRGPALGPGDGHPFAGAHADQVGLKLGDHAEHVEQQPPDGVGGVADAAAEAEGLALVGELSGDVAGIGQSTSQAVEPGDHEGVAAAGRRHGLP